MQTTPVIQQYLDIKASHQDSLLFFRMGDFYELFFSDAEIASDALNIILTKRGQHKGKDIPMCGVPFHSAEGYIKTLLDHNMKVAICEQLETPQEAKKLMLTHKHKNNIPQTHFLVHAPNEAFTK